jgi:uncharacterized protein (DUF2235 family)
MAKNILIFSDGSGQGASMPSRRTNVLKLYLATKDAAPQSQVAFYDPGLGAADDKDHGWWRWGHDLLSQATGLGISQNVKDCYAAAIRHYEPGDRMYLFGFSRGAYTIRSLGGVLSLCGIPMRDTKGRSPRADQKVRDALVGEAVETVYKHYGNDDKTKAERRKLGEQYRLRYGGNLANSNDPPVPHFIGVFDTVRALGIPGSSGLVGWRHAFHDATLNARVPFARQAISIDENREVFEPVLWEETEADRASGRIKQVWFPGVHSDIGGGYEECELADLALAWMIDEATAIPDPIVVDRAKLPLAPSFKGKQHDERTGWGKAWTEGTRERFNATNLWERHVGDRFNEASVPMMDRSAPYRPRALGKNPVYRTRYPEGDS